jgi:subtilisin family serine protease
MKILFLPLIAFLLVSTSVKSQVDTLLIANIVYDDEGNPLYVANQLLVSFHPDVVDTAAINDTSKRDGYVYEFIRPDILQYLQDSGHFNTDLANLTIQKVFSKLTTNINFSISRLGDTIPMPPFWATFLIDWPSGGSASEQEACDSLNGFFPIVQHATLNHVGTMMSTPNDTHYGSQKSLHVVGGSSPLAQINAQGAWSLQTGKPYIKVAVIDQGIDWKHEDFGNGSFAGSRVKGGFNYLSQKPTHLDSVFVSTSNHGTAVAGIIGALRNNGKGIAGVAGGNAAGDSGVSLYNLRISADDAFGSLTLAHLAASITEAAAWRPDSSFGFGAHIINASVGAIQFEPVGWVPPKIVRDAVKFAYRNKTLLVAARGNSNDDENLFPATYEDDLVLSVGGANGLGNKSDNSSYGKNMDVLAPGTDDIIFTTDLSMNGNGYKTFKGTSAAAPHVAGIAALMASIQNLPYPANANIAPEDVEFLIQKYASNRAAPGYDDETGWGMVHADSVLHKLENPVYFLAHYTPSVQLKKAVLVQASRAVQFKEPYDVFDSSSTYSADVYRIETTVHHSNIPPYLNLIDYWKRHSSTVNLWENASHVMPMEFFEIVSLNRDSAVLRGHIYHVTYTPPFPAPPTRYWLPADTNALATFAYSLHLHDPSVTTGIRPTTVAPFLHLYPNPATGLLNIAAGNDNTLQRLKIYGIDGREIFYQPLATPAQVNTLDISALATGLYILEAHTQRGIFRTKFIKAGL